MSRIAIRATGLGKKYRVGQKRALSFRDAFDDALKRLTPRGKAQAREESEIWALRDVSFEVQEGEVVGVIGRNGAGKSTLLKILSRVTEPTAGRAELFGRVGSLLEVGTGFHSDLTGRENVFLSGAILGMSRLEVVRKFDEIVAFAEVERYIDTQVKHYSSGMYMRLAFSVAAHLEPEILLVDEVLAVGDAAFQKKCLGRMGEIARGGRTVFFVSHNLAAVENLCGTAMLLEDGGLTASGDTSRVLTAYSRSAAKSSADSKGTAGRRPGWARAVVESTEVRTPDGEATAALGIGKPFEVVVSYRETSGEPIRRPVLGIVIRHMSLGVVGGVNSRMTGEPFAGGASPSGFLACLIDRPPLLQGLYEIDVWLGDGESDIDCVEGAASFEILESDFYGSGRTPSRHLGIVWLDATFSHRSPEERGRV